MSFSIILNSNNAYSGSSPSWTFGFDFGAVIPNDSASYELTWALQSQATSLANFTNIPSVNLHIGAVDRIYEATSNTVSKSSKSIGMATINWVTATQNQYYVKTVDNPPVFYSTLNNNNNFITVDFTEQGTSTPLATTVPHFTLILHFKKIN